MAFVHLHVHSEYSLLDGACRIRDLVSGVKAVGQDSVAITDHGVMYGAVSFHKAAKNAGIKPIIGCEVYIAARTRFDMEYDIDSNRHHLVLLCRNETGYRNLCQIVSAAFSEGFYIKPRADMELLRAHSDGLIALSACVSGEIPKLIQNGEYAKAKAKAEELSQIFGEDNFYLELQDHGLRDQPPVNKGLIRIHEETGIPLVVTNDVHYITASDAEVQDVLMCVQTGKTVDDEDRMRFESRELYLKPEAEMRKLFPDYPDAYANTVKIAQRCDFDFEFGKYHLPEFFPPDGENSRDYLKKLCLEGIGRLYGPERADARNQLEYELDMIERMGFTDYFLIVADYVAYAKSRSIPVGPGRGSGAGSIAAYSLGITTVDPLKYGLYFERFLNPERVSMPDFDIDFCERRRAEVVEYVRAKYGEERVAQITTFNTLKAKNAVRSVAKALALTFAEENELAKEIPEVLNIKIADALSSSKRLREMYDGDARIKRVLDTAMAIEDMPKDSGTHAAGVVITKRPVREYVPLALSKKDDSIATQYDWVTCEELGLIKMDFLGLRNLTVIDDAVKEIRKREPGFLIDDIPEYDKDTYDMLSAGKTSGVFQLESQGMTGVCTGLIPKNIEDITAIIALYRPGPMESIPRFLENSKNPEKITYKHPLLEPILRVTYGCIVYQEQVIEIFRKLGGFSLGQADMIRRAMSKKKKAEIEREKAAFISGDPERGICGAVKNGVPADVAAAIYEEIFDFANYAFNKAHAVAYAIIAYQTAYLKRHFPREYMAALISSVLYVPGKVSEYTAECREMGIRLLPPDINESDAMFTVSGGDLRYGLVAVKNIGRGLIESVMAERARGGLFTGFEDFCRRMYGGELNRRALDSLIKCGCFDGFGANRRQLMEICEAVLDFVSEHRRKNVEGQLDLFGIESGGEAQSGGTFELPDVPEFPKAELMRMEREVTGLYLSGHPMDEYRAAVKKAGAVGMGEILADFSREDGNIRFADDQQVTIAGVISAVKTKPTKNNSLMAYVTLEDGTGSMELLAFQRIIDTYGVYMQVNSPVLVTGRISARDEKAPQLVINAMRPVTGEIPDNEPENKTGKFPDTQKKLYVKLESEDSPAYDRLKLLLMMFPGREQVVIVFSDTRKRVGTKCVIHDALVKELEDMLGTDNVKIS